VARKRKQRDPVKVARGAARSAHFEAGGDLAMWRGNARTFRDRRKEKARRACRTQPEEE
jgi:hypothetical protein